MFCGNELLSEELNSQNHVLDTTNATKTVFKLCQHIYALVLHMKIECKLLNIKHVLSN